MPQELVLEIQGDAAAGHTPWRQLHVRGQQATASEPARLQSQLGAGLDLNLNMHCLSL